MPRRSASVETGSFENTCTQPPNPQAMNVSPLSSRRLASSGSSFSTTVNSSSFDSKKKGRLKTLKALSMPAMPLVRAAASGRPVLRSETTLASSPAEPPAKTVRLTRPSEISRQSAAISLSLISQRDPAGASVARRILTRRCATANTGAASRSDRPSNHTRFIAVSTEFRGTNRRCAPTDRARGPAR